MVDKSKRTNTENNRVSSGPTIGLTQRREEENQLGELAHQTLLQGSIREEETKLGLFQSAVHKCLGFCSSCPQCFVETGETLCDQKCRHGA